jgi:hypothetical protein
MRIMVMHKNDAATEAGQPPPPELVAKMGAFVGEHARSGRFLGGEGLGASSTRTRLTFRGGECTVRRGPYAGKNELVAATLLLEVATHDQALGWAQRYGKILGDGELELGPVNEPWDIGVMPRPENPPLRVLLLEKADERSEAGRPRSPRQKADLTRLMTEMTKAGVLVSSQRLQPGSRSKRLVFREHRLSVIDGPFIESKELIGGFAILELPSIDTAIEVCRDYAAILGGTLEIDVRPLAEPDDAA